MNRNVLDSPHILILKKKRQKIFLKKILFFFFLFLIFLIIFGLISRWKEINIENIEIQGNKVLENKELEELVKEELKEYYFFIFPKSNIFLYPKGDIKNKLENKFKRLENISFEIKNERTLQIYMTERKATYIWCGESPYLNAEIILDEKELENQCYFIDEKGYLFDKAPYFSGNVYFKFFGILSNDENQKVKQKENENLLGLYFLPEIFSKIITLKDDIISFGLEPVSLFLKDNGEIELYLLSSSIPPYAPRIIFKENSDMNKIAQNLEAAIRTEPLKSDLENKYSLLSYINLSFNNKIYYKFSDKKEFVTEEE